MKPLSLLLALVGALHAQQVETPRGARLEVLVDAPAGSAEAPALVLAPGQGYHMRLPLLASIAREAAAAGFVAVRFDWAYRASGGSPSEDLSAELEDLGAVLAWTKAHERVDPARVHLAGKSLGSIVAHRAFRADPSLAALVLLTPVFEGAGEVDDVYPDLARLGRPAVIVVGDADRLCPLGRLHEALAGAAIPVVVVAGDHGLNSGPHDDPAWAERNAENVEAAARATAYWLRVLATR